MMFSNCYHITSYHVCFRCQAGLAGLEPSTCRLDYGTIQVRMVIFRMTVFAQQIALIQFDNNLIPTF